MYANKALALGMIISISLFGATKQTLEEKVEKRFSFIANKHNALIQGTQERVEYLQELMEKILSSDCKRSLNSATQESLETFLMNIVTRIKDAQEKYLVEMAVIYKKITNKKISKTEMQESSALYAKHLALFSDEIAFLIKLLLPLKDMDTMTEEEIQAVLTV